MSLYAAVSLLSSNPTLGDQLSPEQIYPQPIPSTHFDPNTSPAIKSARITLGKQLFSDTLLSKHNNYSCASCHIPTLHFTDGLPVAIGALGEPHQLHTPTLYNVGLNSSFGWQDQNITQLEQQHLVPLFNQHPVEMGFSSNVLPRLSDKYPSLLQTGFNTNSATTIIVVQAIAAWIRTIKAPVSKFDRFLFLDEPLAFTEQEKAGLELFFSTRLGCSSCHANLTFSGPISFMAKDGSLVRAPPVFHNTKVGNSVQAFRAPTLRQIANTAPYMHNGSLATLQQVIEHYQNVDAERVPKFQLSDKESQALLAFLNTL